MKLSTSLFFGCIAVLFGITIVSSCTNTEPIEGSWQGTPTSLIIPYSADATSTTTLSFVPEGNGKKGDVDISLVIDVRQATDDIGNEAGEVPFEANVTATATAKGSYIFDSDDDDDLIIVLDHSSFNVNVDPSGVMFGTNVTTGQPQAVLDSLSAATADKWRSIIGQSARSEMERYSKIEDIKVHHGSMMSCEIDHRDFSFIKI